MGGKAGDRLMQAAFAASCAALGLYFVALLVAGAAFYEPARAGAVAASAEFRAALWLSLWTATLATVLAVLVALPVGWFLSRVAFPGKVVVDALLDLPTVLSPIATGTLLLMLFHTGCGRWLQAHGLTFVYTRAGVVLAQATIVVALAVRLLKATFDAIPLRYEQLARVLGCSRFQAFRRVALPLARPGLLAAVVICWARAFGEYGATVTLAGAMPLRTETVPVGIQLALATVDLAGAVVLIGVLVGGALAVLVALRLLARTGEVPR